MNTGKYIFAQMVEFLPQRVFNGFAAKYGGNKYVKHFTCWNQLLVMMFGQLTNRDSLRDVIVATDAHSKKTYHLGFGKNITRSNLSKANEKRDSRIFEDYAYYLINIARRRRANDDFEINDKETNRTYAYLTNKMELTSEQIALLNKYRWKGEFQMDKTTTENKVILGYN